MMTTTKFSILAEPLPSDQALKERPRVAERQRSVIRSKVEIELETRLWKVCAKAASPRLSGFEWVAFLMLAIAAFAALVCCFPESFQLFNSGALDETVRVLLTR